jgi:uncharacterized protein
MPLLIDGYNLLHASGVFGEGTALTELHRSREALLAFLASSLEQAERSRATIVFDAAAAPPGLPQSYSYEGIHVQFARDPGNADELLENLIDAHDTPRKLIVVSSDHRVQRAARRRRATAVDSDKWWADLCANRHRQEAEPPRKPSTESTAGEVAYWLAQFTDVPEIAPNRRHNAAPSDDFENPFPPGYGDDLLDEVD